MNIIKPVSFSINTSDSDFMQSFYDAMKAQQASFESIMQQHGVASVTWAGTNEVIIVFNDNVTVNEALHAALYDSLETKGFDVCNSAIEDDNCIYVELTQSFGVMYCENITLSVALDYSYAIGLLYNM